MEYLKINSENTKENNDLIFKSILVHLDSENESRKLIKLLSNINSSETTNVLLILKDLEKEFQLKKNDIFLKEIYLEN